jgi:glycosyltransferase involved in cell wall biosynthesis
MRVFIEHCGSAFPLKGGADRFVLASARLLAQSHDVTLLTSRGECACSAQEGRLEIIQLGAGTSASGRGLRSQEPHFAGLRAVGSDFGLFQFLRILDRTSREHSAQNLLASEYDVAIHEGPNRDSIASRCAKKFGIPLVERPLWVGYHWTIPKASRWLRLTEFGGAVTNVIVEKAERPLDRAISSLEALCLRSVRVLALSPLDARKAVSARSSIKADYVYPTDLTESAIGVSRRPHCNSAPDSRIRGDDYILFFSGSNKYSRLALQFLVSAAKRLPQIRIVSSGVSAGTDLVSSCPPNLHIENWTSDAEFCALVKHARLVVFPVIASHGVATKLIQAMAFGKPILTTSAIIRPLECIQKGIDLLVEDDPIMFINRMETLFWDDSTLKQLGDASSACYRSNFSNDLYKRRLEHYLVRVNAES